MKKIESDELLIDGKAIIEIEVPIHDMVEDGTFIRDINNLLLAFKGAYEKWKESWQTWSVQRPHKKVTVNFEEKIE